MFLGIGHGFGFGGKDLLYEDVKLTRSMVIKSRCGRRRKMQARVLKPGPVRQVDPGFGRPGPRTGPGGGKNPFGNWPGKTRSTRVNPDETQLFFIYV